MNATRQLPSGPYDVYPGETVALRGQPHGAKLVVCASMNDGAGLDLSFANVDILLADGRGAQALDQVCMGGRRLQWPHVLAWRDTGVAGPGVLYNGCR